MVQIEIYINTINITHNRYVFFQFIVMVPVSKWRFNVCYWWKKTTQKTSELDYLVEIQITYLLLDASIVERTFAFNQDSSDICFLASYCDIMKKDDNARWYQIELS